VKTVWRWCRFLIAIAAALVVAGVVWIGWLLSGQRYQQILTEQLSLLFDARVQVGKSHLSWQNGLGVRFDTVSVKDDRDSTPFFTAAEIELLLDLSALQRGELLFRRIDLIKPNLHIAVEGKRLLRLAARVRESQNALEASSHWAAYGLTPTLAVQELRLRDADIAYAKTPANAPFLMTNTDAALIFATKEKPTLTIRTTLKSKQAEIGRIALRVEAATEVNLETLGQSEWTGSVEVSNVQVQQLGRIWGVQWPNAKFDFNGRLQGQRGGPIELTGSLNVSDMQVGEILLREARLQVVKGRWSGAAPRSIWRSLALEARLEEVRGQVGKGEATLVVKTGEVTVRDDNLSAANLSGGYGKTSQFSDGKVLFRRLSAKDGPMLEAQVAANLNLEDDLAQLLAAMMPRGFPSLSQFLVHPQGKAVARVRMQRAGEKSEPKFDGSVTLQHVGGQLVPWKLSVEEVNGDIQLNADALSTEALTLRVGRSRLKVQGAVHDVLSARRSADLKLAFNEVRDHDLAPFFPPRKVLPHDGFLSGQLRLILPTNGAAPDIAGHIAFNHIRLDLLDFLHPFEVEDGELTLAGQKGTFTVKRGRLPGGNFSGRGKVISWTPLKLEVVGDFPDLNLDSALALNKPDDGLPKESTRDIRAELISNRSTYKGSQIENLRLFCHWHGRQADLRITQANVAKGGIQGEAILWPDIDAAYLAPHLTAVDVERFFQIVGVSTKALTGRLSGEGKIYMPNWAQWDELARWDAALSFAVEDGVAQRLPILVRLWSVLSMQGLLRLQLPSLPTEGLPFSSLTGDFALGKGTAVTHNLSLSGNSVRLDARGEIDLRQRILDLKIALAPLHGITSSVAKVPLAGELLARGADYLTTLNFRVSGPYADPTVTPLLIDTGGR
jgi:uncharacterized protein YhdP